MLIKKQTEKFYTPHRITRYMRSLNASDVELKIKILQSGHPPKKTEELHHQSQNIFSKIQPALRFFI